MKIERKFTSAKADAYAGLDFTLTVSEIRNPDGSVVFRNDAVEVPAGWSQVASDVLAQKYFRKAGVAVHLKRVKEASVPEFLCVLSQMRLRWQICQKKIGSWARPVRAKCLIVWRVHGPIGAGRGDTSRLRRMHALIMMKCG